MSGKELYISCQSTLRTGTSNIVNRTLCVTATKLWDQVSRFNVRVCVCVCLCLCVRSLWKIPILAHCSESTWSNSTKHSISSSIYLPFFFCVGRELLFSFPLIIIETIFRVITLKHLAYRGSWSSLSLELSAWLTIEMVHEFQILVEHTGLAT